MIELLLIGFLGIGKEIKGQVIIWLKPEARNLIVYNKEKIETGIPDVDLILKKFSVYEVDRLTKGVIPKEAKQFDLDLIFLIKFPEEIENKKLIENLKGLEIVKDAFSNIAYPVDVIPNDPYFSQMWNLTKMQVPEAWDIERGDSSVVVGAADTGLWWEHVDIRDNLWVNPGEDLNGNGKFDYPQDLNGIDDDGNGYVDDLIGWNFTWGTWNPSPQPSVGWDHGTHVTGTMAAITDNGIGISGIGWKIKAVGMNCQLIYNDTSYINFYGTVEAHYYAANMGLKVINNSWGGYGWSSSQRNMMQAAIDYARLKGVTVLAAAGNENASSYLYPASLRGVISVAASNQLDKKAFFSNYGDSVDVTAPGVDIWSTIPNNGYDSWMGTSMACPNAAGVCALIISHFPNLTPKQVEEYLEGGAENIDTLNPGYEGKLGAGRVNAYRSLLYPFTSGAKIIDFQIVEINGDNDRFYEGGELIGILITVLNKGPQPVNHLRVTLKPSFGYSIVDSIVEYNQVIPKGVSVNITSDTFKILLNNLNARDTLLFEINASPQTFYPTNKFTFFIGIPDILVYYTDNTNKFYTYYEKAISKMNEIYGLNITYDIWKSSVRGIPTLSTSMPPIVIWATGNDSLNVLSSSEIDTMINYLTLGGKLVFTSQFAAENINTTLDTLFFRDYLGVDKFYVPLGSGKNYAKGLSGDPLTSGWFLYLGSSSGADNNISPDEILNDTLNGTICLKYGTTGQYRGAGVRTSNTVFFAFPLESVPLTGTGTLTLLHKVIYDILRYFSIVEVKEDITEFKRKEKVKFSFITTSNRINELFKSYSKYSITGQKVLNPKRKGIYLLKKENKNVKVLIIK
ncbi:MAG: S8 family peptidase [candidate division WOR-3 bacterium]